MIVLGEATRRSVRVALGSGVVTAILPLGATEQHGEALPFGTDTIIAELVSLNLAKRLNALLLPSMPYGVSLEHIGTPGTITLSAQTLVRVIRETCESLISNGVARIILLVAHFGNLGPAEIAAQELIIETGALVCVSNYFAGMREASMDMLGLEQGKFDWDYFNSHGGAAETAMVMSRDADLVDLGAAQSASPDIAKAFYDVEMRYPQKVEAISTTGQWGDPRQVSPDADVRVDGSLGSRLIDACGERLAKKFTDLVNTLERDDR